MTNSKSTKRALLTSSLAMLMCVAMLIGTTFAWFTDTASTAVNKIQAGTLDVELYYANNTTGEEATWTKITDKTGAMQFVKAKAGEGQEILWEPGCTYSLPALKIKNEGNLALKYKVLFSAVDTDEKNLELAKVLDVTMNGNPAGTLYDVLTSTDADGYAHGNLAGETETDPITLSVKMRETAGNEYQKLAIGGIAITVVATQDTVEYDSKDNKYDKDAVYPIASVNTAEDFTKALADTSVETIVLSGDMTLENISVSVNHDVTIDLNGKKLETTSAGKVAVEVTNGTLTLTGDGEITGATCVKVTDGGKAVIEGGTYTATGGYAVYAAGENAKVIISGGTFSSTEEKAAIRVTDKATIWVVDFSCYGSVEAKGGNLILGGGSITG